MSKHYLTQSGSYSEDPHSTNEARELYGARLLDQLITARNAAGVVAKATILEDLQQTLTSVVRETQHVLGCDAVTVYIYDRNKGRLKHPPIMHGVQYPERASRYIEVPADSIVLNILQREQLSLINDISNDPLFKDTRFAREEQVESCCAAPLKVGGEAVGVMFINYRSSHWFTDDDQTNIDLLANQAAMAIRNAQLYQGLQQRVHMLKTMYKAGQAMTSILTLKEALGQIVTQAFLLVEGKEEDGCFTHLSLAEGDVLRFTTAYPPSTLTGLHGRIGDIDLKHSARIGVTGRTFLSGESQNVQDVLKDTDYIETDPRIRSELAVPVRVNDQVIGVINIEHPEYHAFDDEDRQALETLAGYAASAIKNARLYAQSQADKQRLEAMARISKEAAVSLDTAQLLRTVCQRLERDANKPVIVSIRLYDPEEGVLVFNPKWHEPFPSGTAAQWVEGRTIQRLDEGICGWVATHRKAFKTGNIHTDTAPHYIQRSIKSTNTRSELCVPICYGEESKLVGVLDMQSSEINALDDGDEQLLTILADQLAVAIQHARQYNELREIKGYVGSRTAIGWMKMMSNTWAHSIRREVGTALRRITLIRGMLDRAGPPLDVYQELSHLEQEIYAINDIPIVAPLSSSDDDLDSIKINELIQTYLERQWQHPRYQAVQLRMRLYEPLDTLVRARASRAWLRQALEILVDNAVQTMLEANSPTKHLTITTELAGNEVEIAIRDSGPGLPGEMLTEQFEAPVNNQEGGRGTGIGLVVVQTIARTYGGSLRVRSTGSTGTDMILGLPVQYERLERS